MSKRYRLDALTNQELVEARLGVKYLLVVANTPNRKTGHRSVWLASKIGAHIEQRRMLGYVTKVSQALRYKKRHSIDSVVWLSSAARVLDMKFTPVVENMIHQARNNSAFFEQVCQNSA